jgi:bacillithiol synthase
MQINFSDIPKNHNLFLDYLYEFENVSEFYKYDFRDKENYGQVFRQIVQSRTKKEIELTSVIYKQYRDLPNASEKTLANISGLSDAKSLAVVTGQQLGLFGGPMYTFYKIITAIKLARQLKERYEEYNFIPVFWLEGDDHDFNEIRWIKLINNLNELTEITYAEEIPEDGAKQSVGPLTLSKEIHSVLGKIKISLRETEFSPALFSRLSEIYSEGKTIKQAFKELVFWLFDEYGLVILDPQDKEIKSLLIPVFMKEIEGFREHTQKLVLTSARLEEVYHAQVKIKPVNLFFSTEDGRYAIEPVDDIFRLRRKRKQFSKEELLETIQKEPERFSPNVLLRPICQDYLLPTALYIAGPSEIAYFAQVTRLYDFFEIITPIIYPRASATIVEKSIQSTMDKFNLELKDIFIKSEVLKDQVIAAVSENNLDNLFEDANKQIELLFDELKTRLFSVDKTISDSSERYRDKVLLSFTDLKNKAIQAQKKKHEISLKQIDKISESLYPSENLQERELNFIYFVNKYGESFLKKLFDEILVNNYEHQIIQI